MLYHYESLSRGYEDTPEKQARFLREVEYMRKKWEYILDNDPHYNPNLTRDREDFSIRIMKLQRDCSNNTLLINLFT